MCHENILEANAGRFKGIARDRRVCPLCSLGIEDECHFLWTCPNFEAERCEILSVINDYMDLNTFFDMSLYERTLMILGAGNDFLYEYEYFELLASIAAPLGRMYIRRCQLLPKKPHPKL